MAEVTGYLGNDQISLDNAATESTLSKLLASNQANQGILKLMAEQMGVAPQAIESFSNAASGAESLSKSTKSASGTLDGLGTAGIGVAKSFYNIDRTITPLVSKLIEGTASIKDVTDVFGKLNPVIGIATTLFGRLVEFQEKNLEVYQQISNSGVSFSGSLTDLRMAAANSYVTLDQFAKILTSNQDAFLRIGGSVNEGAVAFSKFSHNFISGDLGNQMMSLGYTTEQVNQYLATYIGNAGANNIKDLESSSQLRSGATAYLEELDRLAEVTGKSREELNEERKIKKLDADVQLTASRMKGQERELFLANYTYMKDMYGAAGADVALAQAQGRSVVTKQGQMLTAITGGSITSAMDHLSEVGKLYGVGSKEYIAAQNEMSLKINDSYAQIDPTLFSVNSQLQQLGDVTKTVAQQTDSGLTDKKAFEARDAAIAKDRIEREKSQAADMAAANKAMKELGQALLDLVSPIVSLVTPVIKGMAEHLKDVVTHFGKLALVLGSAYGAFKLTSMFVNSTGGANATNGIGNAVVSLIQQRFAGGKAGAVAGSVSSVLGKADGSKLNPFYVIIAGGGGAGGGIIEEMLENEKGGGKGAAKGVSRTTALRTLANAKKYAKIAAKYAGGIGTAIELVNLGSNLLDINEKEKKGAISADQAKKETGGAIGEAGGGIAGATAGAAAGAALGTALFPVVGTFIGGAIGAALGGFGGGGIGKAIGEWLGTTTKKEEAKQEDKEKSTDKKTDSEILSEMLEHSRTQTELLTNSSNHLQLQTAILHGVRDNTNDFRPSWVAP